MENPAARCDECGALHRGGVTCRACFEALLAFENERPVAFGAVHHLTVACYFLQHPRGYNASALQMWRDLLADSLDGRVTAKDLIRRAGRQFNGARRVRDPRAALPAWWPPAWPVTVDAVLRPDEQPTIDTYVQRAYEWAGQTRAQLEAQQRAIPVAPDQGVRHTR